MRDQAALLRETTGAGEFRGLVAAAESLLCSTGTCHTLAWTREMLFFPTADDTDEGFAYAEEGSAAGKALLKGFEELDGHAVELIWAVHNATEAARSLNRLVCGDGGENEECKDGALIDMGELEEYDDVNSFGDLLLKLSNVSQVKALAHMLPNLVGNFNRTLFVEQVI